MADRPNWRGSIIFGGFPINVAAYNTHASRAGQSFKGLCPCHQLPIQQIKVCPVDGQKVDNGDLLKGVEISRGDVRMVPLEAVEALREAESSASVEILRQPRAESVPLELAMAHFRLVPDPKIPGSEQGVQILWNGLRESKRAILVEVVMRAGSRQTLNAIVADTYGLLMHQIPYATDRRDTPEFKPVENEQAAAMFEQFSQIAGINMDDYSPNVFVDRYVEKRDELVRRALAGDPIEVPAKAAEDAPAVPDLMAAMKAALASAPAKKKPARKTAPAPRKKAAA